MSNPENLDYWGINDGLLDDETKAHPYVVQFVPYLFTLHGRRIVANSKTKAFQDAFDCIYAKIGSLKTTEDSHNAVESAEDKHLQDTIYSSEWIRECLVELMSDFVGVNGNREITVIQKKVPHTCESDNDHSRSNVYIHLRASGFDLSNVKRLHTIVNALYNAYFNIIDEVHRLNEILKFYGTVQLQVARTVISIDDVREQIEHMQSDLQKIFRYFTANATPYELSKILDTCLEVAVADNILALLNTAPYRVMSAFCKLLHSKRFSPYTFKHSPAYNSIELPRLHYGFSKSEFCEEIQKSKYYQDFRTKYDDVLTVENFVAHINNDKSYCFKIDVFSCSERDDENNIIQQYPHIFRFHLRNDRDFVGLEALQDVVAQYFAIVEYFNARYGLVEFYCYGDCMFTKSDSKSTELKQTELAEINRALFKTFEECKEAGRISSFIELIMNDNKPTNPGDQTSSEKEESSESSEETNPDMNPF